MLSDIFGAFELLAFQQRLDFAQAPFGGERMCVAWGDAAEPPDALAAKLGFVGIAAAATHRNCQYSVLAGRKYRTCRMPPGSCLCKGQRETTFEDAHWNLKTWKAVIPSTVNCRFELAEPGYSPATPPVPPGCASHAR